MLEFQEKKLDMLVCTKIIESGLDIPNVNTIIVNRADRFGMSELYQLRGRVGRSNLQAYAYLLVPPISSMPRGTIQRLQAVEEFTELGSGFNLAMRDLEIRGAGNLLGAEQSGFIESMGFETYTRILDDAVTELKEQEFRDIFPHEEGRKGPAPDTVVDVDFEALIPSSYVENDSERLEMYRKMYGVTTEAQLEELGEDMEDRFGPHPIEVQNLFATVRVRLAGAELGFRRIAIGAEGFDVEFPPEGEKSYYESRDFQVLMTELSRWRERKLILKQEGKALKLSSRFLKNEDPIPTTLQFLRRLRDLLHETAPESA
jgi:transcription-repair coupling factor (superfamily II helicase)